MNKANKFKRRAFSQNENLVTTQTEKSVQDQNSFIADSNHYTKHHRMYSSFRRVSTENFEIEPFRDIENYASTQSYKETANCFIKTKKAKLYPKSKTSFKQIETQNQPPQQNVKFKTNFQILKRQIKELETSNILRRETSIKQQNPEQNFNLKDQQFIDNLWNQNKVFVVKGQFSYGKNISLFEKQRQNIKKVMKNKKFRNYINPLKRRPESPKIGAISLNNRVESPKICAEPFKEGAGFTLDKNGNLQKYNEDYGQQTLNYLKTLNVSEIIKPTFYHVNDSLKKRQTPQIVRKYYRPQSCNTKRQVSFRNSKSIQVGAANYTSSCSLSKDRKKGKVLVSSKNESLYANKDKKFHHSKELLIICL